MVQVQNTNQVFLAASRVGNSLPPPGAPTNPQLINYSADQVRFSWSQGTPPDTNEVWVSRNGAPYVLLISVAGGVTSYDDPTNMIAGDDWTYKVRAVVSGVPTAFTTPITVLFNYSIDAGATDFIRPDVVLIVGDFFNYNEYALGPVDLSGLLLVTGSVDFILDDPLGGATSIDMSSVIAIGGHFNIQNLDFLTSLNLGSLVTVGDYLAFPGSGYDSLVNVDVSSLVSCAGSLDFSNHAVLPGISFNSLVSVGGYMAGVSNFISASLVTPLLATVGFDLDADSCPLMPSYDFPSLIFIGNTFLVNDCNLSSLNIPNVLFGTDATFSIAFNPLPDAPKGVNLFLARCVASGLTSSFINAGGIGPAAPTGQGLIDKATLESFLGNTVITN